jgi:hypothetical protein
LAIEWGSSVRGFNEIKKLFAQVYARIDKAV